MTPTVSKALMVTVAAATVIACGSSTQTVPPGKAIPVSKARSATAAATAKAAKCSLTSGRSPGYTHTMARVRYRTNPPASGPHAPIAARDGAYTTAPPLEKLVHSAEHGRVILWYRPGASHRARMQLQTIFAADPRLIVLTPDPAGMKYVIAASAWTGDRKASPPLPELGHVLGCGHVNARTARAVRAFIGAYRDRGPERFIPPNRP